MNNNMRMMKIINLALILSIAVLAFMVGYYYRQAKNQAIYGGPYGIPSIYSNRLVTNEATVEITSNGLLPETVSINKGMKVTWTNTDVLPHRITAINESSTVVFDSEIIEPGESFSFTFAKEGTYSYHDTDNPVNIVGSVIVK